MQFTNKRLVLAGGICLLAGGLFSTELLSGVQDGQIPDDLMEAARKESIALYEEQAAADPGYRKVYDHWKDFRASAYRWFGTAEDAYARFAFATESRG